MNVLEIPDGLQSKVLDKNETGMGFQVVRARVTYTMHGHHHVIEGMCLVLTSRMIVPYDPQPDVFAVGNLPEVGLSRAFPPGLEIDDLDVTDVMQPRTSAAILMTYNAPPTKLSPAQAPAQIALPMSGNTRAYEAFIRFSAYPNDNRVLSNGGLRPGTFATTFNDARLTPSGLAAVGRYALSNPLPAKYVYTIVPPQNTSIQIGAVLPNNHQAGGGVGVFFPNGCSSTTLLPHEVPEA